MERKGPVDLIILFTTLVLLAIGLVMVLSSSSYEALISYHDALHYFKSQAGFMVVGFFAMWVMAQMRIRDVQRLALPMLVVCVIMLMVVLVNGVEVNGAKRWLKIAGIRFAPAEAAKPVIIVFFAMWLRGVGKQYLQSFQGFLVTLGILAIIPAIIVKEDLGTAISIAAALFVMMILAQVPWKYLAGTILAGILFIVAMVLVAPYRIKRITAFLNPFEDPLGSGYQAVQSLYAIGSGGFFGVGLGASRQKLLHLPERHTDFIFSILCEELGFVGGAFVILLFAIFVWRGMQLAMSMDDKFMAYATCGLTAVIGIQAAINIGVAVGAMPVTGITLPFISYGGTSLIFMMATAGFLLNLSRYRKR